MTTATVDNTVAQNLAAWPDNLRSGEFEQTTGHLKDDTGYCCIGVLDETVLGASWVYVQDMFIDQNGRGSTLNQAEAAKAGLDKTITLEEMAVIEDYFMNVELDGMINFNIYETRQSVLTALNDKGATFEEIADVIEKLEWNQIGE